MQSEILDLITLNRKNIKIENYRFIALHRPLVNLIERLNFSNFMVEDFTVDEDSMKDVVSEAMKNTYSIFDSTQVSFSTLRLSYQLFEEKFISSMKILPLNIQSTLKYLGIDFLKSIPIFILCLLYSMLRKSRFDRNRYKNI